MFRNLKQLLIGRPLHNMEAPHEKLPIWKALSIFSSDALSSVGYGPEQIAIVLAIPGMMAYGYYYYSFFAVILLLGIVTASYVQVARSNPGGGGSYSVAMKNLGELPALIAAASLFADYTLTVAVSISSGTEALISAFPALLEYEVALDLIVLFGILMLVNLRGIRESADVFVLPTYLFVFGMLALIGAGAYQAFTQPSPVIPAASMARQAFDWSILVLVLRAFANGCSSMTGIEAISNGVPMFKRPEVSNAVKTTYLMSALLAVMLSGIAFLILHYHILPEANVTALSQVAELTLGRNAGYYYIQVTTMLVLYLAANTSFNGLPPLLSILAKDGYMPRYLGSRGDRLSFSNGIVLLSVVAGMLIVFFKGNVEQLISLYAIGVFLSFTIAQIGLVVHWRQERTKGWRQRSFVNGFGAVTTGVVVLVIAVTKFFYGAWIVLLFIPAMIWIFRKIHHHYLDVAEQLHFPRETAERVFQSAVGKNIVVIPVSSPTRVVGETVKYARTLSGSVIAVHVCVDEEAGKRVADKWAALLPDIRLETIYSPYRITLKPLVSYIEKLQKEKAREDYITVLIPEFQTKKWWHRLLHNQTGFILQALLILKENVVVATIPYHLRR